LAYPTVLPCSKTYGQPLEVSEKSSLKRTSSRGGGGGLGSGGGGSGLGSGGGGSGLGSGGGGSGLGSGGGGGGLGSGVVDSVVSPARLIHGGVFIQPMSLDATTAPVTAPIKVAIVVIIPGIVVINEVRIDHKEFLLGPGLPELAITALWHYAIPHLISEEFRRSSHLGYTHLQALLRCCRTCLLTNSERKGHTYAVRFSKISARFFFSRCCFYLDRRSRSCQGASNKNSSKVVVRLAKGSSK
jgi:hypothetical protein